MKRKYIFHGVILARLTETKIKYLCFKKEGLE